MEKLIKKVEAWSNERGLNAADPRKQRLKLWEEFGELNAAIARDNREGAIDAIGDMLVVMIIYRQQLGCKYTVESIFLPCKNRLDNQESLEISELLEVVALNIHRTKESTAWIKDVVTYLYAISNKFDVTLEECLQSAYDVIKDRKGKMINGVFVKESDLCGDR